MQQQTRVQWQQREGVEMSRDILTSPRLDSIVWSIMASRPLNDDEVLNEMNKMVSLAEFDFCLQDVAT